MLASDQFTDIDFADGMIDSMIDSMIESVKNINDATFRSSGCSRFDKKVSDETTIFPALNLERST
jgi:hypothetical protein